MGTWLKKARGHLCMQSKHGGMFFFALSFPLVSTKADSPAALGRERPLIYHCECTAMYFFLHAFPRWKRKQQVPDPCKVFFAMLICLRSVCHYPICPAQNLGETRLKKEKEVNKTQSIACTSVRENLLPREREMEREPRTKVCCQQGKQHAIRRARKGGKELVYPYPLGVSCSCFPPMHNWTNPPSPLLSHASGALCPFCFTPTFNVQIGVVESAPGQLWKESFHAREKETEECAMCKCALREGTEVGVQGRGGIEWPLTLSHTLTLLTVIPPLFLPSPPNE